MKNTFQYLGNSSFIVLLVTLLVSCGTTTTEVHEEHHDEENVVELSQAQYDQAGIELGAIDKRNIGSELRVNGTIDLPPQSNISINMPYGGFVKYTDMLPGTAVKKGQLLVIIENPDFIQFQQDYLEGLASQEFLKAEFDRQSELYEEKVASGKSFQQAKSLYLANEARIKTMEARLKLIGFNLSKVRNGEIFVSVNLYAPVTGKVREVYTNIGKYINPQDVIMDITNSDDLHVELTVYENDFSRIKKGQRIRFAIANTPKTEWLEAEVFLVGSGVREDRSVTVHGHLKEKYQDLLPGMYVTAKIETELNEVWAVSTEAVVRFAGKHFIFGYAEELVEDGEKVHAFDMLEVTLGNAEDGFTEIAFVDSTIVHSKVKLVSQGAFTLLAKAKNTEEEGGGHGH